MTLKEKIKNFNVYWFMGLVFVFLSLLIIITGVINEDKLILIIGLILFIIHLCFAILDVLDNKNELMEAQK